MKTKKILASMALLLSVAFSLFFFSSFTVQKPPCTVTVTYYANSGAFTTASIDNCNGVQNSGGVPVSTNWPTSLNGTGCTTMNFTFGVTGGSAPGSVLIYKNGVQVQSFSVPRFTPILIDHAEAATCGDHFDIYY